MALPVSGRAGQDDIPGHQGEEKVGEKIRGGNGILQERGAKLLVSPASWGPGDCGPLGEWEQRTLDTGLPIMVCNRSGWEADDLDFNEAVSVVARDGKRVLEAFCGEESAVLVFDWDLESMTPISDDYEVAWL